MLLSAVVYWTIWGWKFAVGVVLFIYVHETGHVQAAGILRKLTWQPEIGPRQNELGYGTSLTGAWTLRRTIAITRRSD